MKITGLRGWNDVGYVEGGIEQPSISTITIGLAPGTEDVKVTSDLHPSVGKQFSQLKVAIAKWEDWRNLSYIEATMTPNANNTPATSYVYYGWVEKVELISDTSGQAVVQIDWTVDWWRTFLASASLDAGRILRRPAPTNPSTGWPPIQNWPYKYRTVDSSTDIITMDVLSSYEIWWVVVAISDTYDGDKKIVRYLSWPIIGYGDIYGDDGVTPLPIHTYISAHETFTGLWDEIVGVDPSAVLGAWLLPVPPMSHAQLTGSGTQASPLTATTYWKEVDTSYTIGGITYNRCYMETIATASPYRQFPSESDTLGSALTSYEEAPVVLTGFTFEKLLDIPCGMTIQSFTWRVMMSATECNLEIRFDGFVSRMEGLCLTIPAPALDLTENSWSSYQYSGQRQYEIDARNVASAAKGVEGVLSGGAQGALVGGFGPMGAAAGSAVGFVGPAINAGVELLVVNPEKQVIEDRLHTKQSAGILIPGSALAVFAHGDTPKAMQLQNDPYSASWIVQSIYQKGYAVSEEETDCGTQIGTGTGYWRISELIVTGDIPVEAKRFIAARFDAGVRLT